MTTRDYMEMNGDMDMEYGSQSRPMAAEYGGERPTMPQSGDMDMDDSDGLEGFGQNGSSGMDESDGLEEFGQNGSTGMDESDGLEGFGQNGSNGMDEPSYMNYESSDSSGFDQRDSMGMDDSDGLAGFGQSDHMGMDSDDDDLAGFGQMDTDIDMGMNEPMGMDMDKPEMGMDMDMGMGDSGGMTDEADLTGFGQTHENNGEPMLDMGEGMFAEAADRAENNNLSDILNESGTNDDGSSSFEMGSTGTPRPMPMMSPPPPALTDAISDYRTADMQERERGRSERATDRGMEYRGMSQEPGYQSRGGRGRIKY